MMTVNSVIFSRTYRINYYSMHVYYVILSISGQGSRAACGKMSSGLDPRSVFHPPSSLQIPGTMSSDSGEIELHHCYYTVIN